MFPPQKAKSCGAFHAYQLIAVQEFSSRRSSSSVHPTATTHETGDRPGTEYANPCASMNAPFLAHARRTGRSGVCTLTSELMRAWWYPYSPSPPTAPRVRRLENGINELDPSYTNTAGSVLALEHMPAIRRRLERHEETVASSLGAVIK